MKIFTRDLWKWQEIENIRAENTERGICNSTAHIAGGVLVMCERKLAHKGRHWTKLPDVSVTWTGDDGPAPKDYYKD